MSKASMGTVVLVSAFTAALVSAATVIGVIRYGGPLLGGVGAPAAPADGGGPAATAQVPDLVGLRLDAADELLQGRGLRLVVEARRVAEAEAGSVIEQRPLGHSRVEAGAAVAVVVSEGSDTVTVPALVGKSFVEASAMLEAVGLRVGPVSEAEDGEPGQVLATVPEAGGSLKRDAVVAITVGPAATLAVPRLIGLHRSVAQEKLQKAGLKVGKVSEIYDRRRRGDLVLEQTPAPKTRVPEGSEIDLIVNQGD